MLTEISKDSCMHANVEGRKLSMRRYRGKFKPKPAFEKRLYKPEAKLEK